jgi:hypothetical protein
LQTVIYLSYVNSRTTHFAPSNKPMQPTAPAVAFLTLAILKNAFRSINVALAGAAADGQAVGPRSVPIPAISFVVLVLYTVMCNAAAG